MDRRASGQRHNKELHFAALLATALSAAAPSAAAAEAKTSDVIREFAASTAIDGEVSYLKAGDPTGRRVIFVHGTPGSADGWEEFLTDVPSGFEFVAVDRPGFGESAPRKAVVDLSAQAQALKPLLVERDGKWPILIGHSLGGPVVAQVAADMPDQVDSLVIAAGSLDPNLEKVHFMQPVGEWWPVRQLLPRAIRNANQELMALKVELEELQPKLKTIDHPIIIIHGTVDNLVPYDNVAYMERHFDGNENLSIVTLEGQNHFLPWNSKTEIDAAIQKLSEAAHDG